jgi:uncharacterized protein
MTTASTTDAPMNDMTDTLTHPGERRLQVQAGVRRADWGSASTTREIPDVAARFLAAQRLIAVSAADDDGRLWASVLTGSAGFVSAADETMVRSRVNVSEVDPLHGALTDGRPIGMLAIDPAQRKRMRVNGRARSDGDDLLIDTDQVYANCPKYIRSREPDEPTPIDPRARAVARGEGLSPSQIAWIETADTFFIGTAAAPFGADASHRGGAPGFVVASAGCLTWPEYLGNSMFMTLGNLELDPRCGVIFVDWEHGHTLQLTGRAVTSWEADRAALFPDALGVVDFEITEVVEVRNHLPVTWSSGDLWRLTPPAPDPSAR